MYDEVMVQLALRAKAQTLSVATTGSTLLSATSTGFSRATGSFVADGFYPGMWFTRTGFATNTPGVVTGVTATDLTVTLFLITYSSGVQTVSNPAMTVESAASGRTIAVPLPAMQSYENVAFQPTAGVPWVEEQFIPGPASQVTIGPLGELEALPMYALYVNVPAETGLTVKRYVNALRTLFAPRTAIPLANGDVLRVRSDTGPYAGQLQQGQPGFAVQPLTIPLRIRTANVI